MLLRMHGGLTRRLLLERARPGSHTSHCAQHRALVAAAAHRKWRVPHYRRKVVVQAGRHPVRLPVVVDSEGAWPQTLQHQHGACTRWSALSASKCGNLHSLAARRQGAWRHVGRAPRAGPTEKVGSKSRRWHSCRQGGRYSLGRVAEVPPAPVRRSHRTSTTPAVSLNSHHATLPGLGMRSAAPERCRAHICRPPRPRCMPPLPPAWQFGSGWVGTQLSCGGQLAGQIQLSRVWAGYAMRPAGSRSPT